MQLYVLIWIIKTAKPHLINNLLTEFETDLLMA